MWSVRIVFFKLLFTELEDKLLSLQMMQPGPTRLRVMDKPLLMVVRGIKLQEDMARLTRQLVPEPQGGLGREILLDLNLVAKT